MTIADWGSVVIAAVVLVTSALRFAKGRPNTRLLWASLAMIIPLAGSVSIVFAWADPIFGGESYVNLFTHLVMVFCQWSVARATEDTLQAIAPKDTRAFALRGWVPWVALVGTIVSFLWLDPNGSSRGLSEYGSDPAYVAYWGFTIAPIVIPAFALVPRIWRALCIEGIPRLVRVALGLLMASYVGSALILAVFAITAVFPVLEAFRDSTSTVVLALFALALLVSTAALPPAGERPRRPAPRRPIPAPHPARCDAPNTPVTR